MAVEKSNCLGKILIIPVSKPEEHTEAIKAAHEWCKKTTGQNLHSIDQAETVDVHGITGVHHKAMFKTLSDITIKKQQRIRGQTGWGGGGGGGGGVALVRWTNI